jgi:hypothetical protein
MIGFPLKNSDEAISGVASRKNNGGLKEMANITLGSKGPKEKNVEIVFAKNLMNPFAKVFPSKREVEAGKYLQPVLDANGQKIVEGQDAKGFDIYQMQPALDADGNEVPVTTNAKGQPIPRIINLGDVLNKRASQRSSFETEALSKARVDISLPNEQPDSNLRKRNISVPLAFLSDAGQNTFKLTIKPSAYKNGISVQVPTAPYTLDKKGNKVPVQTEYRDYGNASGAVSQKLMAPVGFDSKGEAVWDLGSAGPKVVKSTNAALIAELETNKIEYKTYDTAVKYDYRKDTMKVSELKDVLHYENNKSKAIEDPAYDVQAQADAAMETPAGDEFEA